MGIKDEGGVEVEAWCVYVCVCVDIYFVQYQVI